MTRLENLIEQYGQANPGSMVRTNDGRLRCYYAGFDFTKLAEWLTEQTRPGPSPSSGHGDMLED